MGGTCEDGYDQGMDSREQLLEELRFLHHSLEMLWAAVTRPGLSLAVCNSRYRECLASLDSAEKHANMLPVRASDGTRVWEESPEAAVTNEPRVMNDQVAGRAEDSHGERGSGQERDNVHNVPGPRRSHELDVGGTLSRRETPAEAARREAEKKANSEKRRLAQLRKPRVRKRKS